MSSRLDRLLQLLAVGSTQVIRSHAAEQIGAAQRDQPDQLQTLIAKLHPYLRSSQWSTRVAASEALQHVCAHLRHQMDGSPDVAEDTSCDGMQSSSRATAAAPSSDILLNLSSFSPASVISKGTLMVASSGREYATHSSSSSHASLSERVLSHRRELLHRLGCYEEFGGVGGLIDESDVRTSDETTAEADNTKIEEKATETTNAPMSARERNKARRDAKANDRRRQRESESGADCQTELAQPSHKRAKLASNSPTADQSPTDISTSSPIAASPFDSSEFGPFVRSDGSHALMPLVSRLLLQLLDTNWESRHGAALALRAVLRHHAARLGCDLRRARTPDQRATSACAHQSFLSDSCARILCLLMLDRFGDFSSERTSYPVRESSAQLLGLLASELNSDLLLLLVRHLRHLTDRTEPDLRYAAFIGLKYVLAVRLTATLTPKVSEHAPSLHADLLRIVLDPLIASLRDPSDDVRGMVAESVMAVVRCAATITDGTMIDQARRDGLVHALWSALDLCDDLTASTAQIMETMRDTYEWMATQSTNGQPHHDTPVSSSLGAPLSLVARLARLFPFLDHELRSVKLNAWKTILTMLRLDLHHADRRLDDTHRDIFTAVVRLSLQAHMAESDVAVQETCESVFRIFTDIDSTAISHDQYVALCDQVVGPSIELLLAPLFKTIPPHLLFRWEAHATVNKAGLTSVHSSVGASITPVLASIDIKLRLSRALGMLYHRLAAVSLASTSALSLAHFARLMDLLRSPHDLFVQMACLTLCEWWRSEVTRRCKGGINRGESYFEWSSTLRSLLEPDTARVRSANTKSLLAQSLIQVSRLQTSSSTREELLVATDHLLFTIEHEANFPLLQERSADYLQTALTLMHASSGMVKSEKVKPESSSDQHMHIEDILDRIVFLLCATLPVPPAVITHSSLPLIDGPKDEPIDEENLSSTDEALLALLQEDADDTDTTASKNAVVEPPPPNFGAPPSMTRGRAHRPSALQAEAASVMSDANVAAAAADASTKFSVSERGAAFFFVALCRKSDADRCVFDLYPTLWSRHIMTGMTIGVAPDKTTSAAPYELARSIHLLQHMLPHVEMKSHPRLITLLPMLMQCIRHTGATPVHHDDAEVQRFLETSARCLVVSYARHMTASCMEAFLHDLLPVLTSASTALSQTTALTCSSSKLSILTLLHDLVLGVPMPLLPYLPFLVLPVLACMSDVSSYAASDDGSQIRSRASSVFGALMTLIPLEAGVPSPSDMSIALQQQRSERRHFLRQLTDGDQVPELELPSGLLTPGVELRSYQRDGVKWMLFLQRFHLHGILCDEMGVGKTIQCCVLLAMSLASRRQQFQHELSIAPTGVAPISALPFRPLPSLVLCPATLVRHWAAEFDQFINPRSCPLRILVYEGTPAQKAAIRKEMFAATSHLPSSSAPDHLRDPIVIMSYESIRRDAAHLAGLTFHHLVCDEGHLLRHGSSQLCRSVKSLRSLSRVLLTGTPLSNHVVELWSIFDFLMPGFLGTEAQFRKEFAQPIQQARHIEVERATTSKKDRRRFDEDEADRRSDRHRAIISAGHVALEQLHRRVLPFLLRRVKSDVLADLPPKVIQDVVVDLSPLQEDLYQLIAPQADEITHEAEATMQGATSSTEADSSRMHTFQALHYLRKLCSHPALVFTPQHPQYRALQAKYFNRASGESIRALRHAPKLLALKELLLECGIGTVIDEDDGGAQRNADESSRPKKKRSSRKKAGADESLVGDDASLSSLAPITAVLPRHRVLIFAQLKSTLDRVEQDLFNAGDDAATPDGFVAGSVSYLRLDGSTPSSQRFDLSQRFNSDPTIDCLLLTTSVGGLGLALTGADTVIFLEHDWDPQRDLQAMDRAHRIGQRASSVQVYRLLCRDTIEQRVMGLQRFKMAMAHAVVNADNASMQTMETAHVVQRLEHNANDRSDTHAKTEKSGASAPSTMSNRLDDEDNTDDASLSSFLAYMQSK